MEDSKMVVERERARHELDVMASGQPIVWECGHGHDSPTDRIPDGAHPETVMFGDDGTPTVTLVRRFGNGRVQSWMAEPQR